MRESDDIEIVIDDTRTFTLRKKPGSDALFKRLEGGLSLKNPFATD